MFLKHQEKKYLIILIVSIILSLFIILTGLYFGEHLSLSSFTRETLTYIGISWLTITFGFLLLINFKNSSKRASIRYSRLGTGLGFIAAGLYFLWISLNNYIG